jgi:3-(3-hydroxy-phenyl)propionate hydroxylase
MTKPMTEHEVVIAGAGPTGVMLGAELALAGVDVVVLERRMEPFPGGRSRGLHARTIEVLDQRGIVERFLAEGQPAQVAAFGGTRLDISDFPTRHAYGLALPQKQFERILAGWTDELGVPISRGQAVIGFTEDESGVTVELSDSEPIRTQYLVGCDGGSSVVRQAAGIGFSGSDATGSWLIAEVAWEAEPAWGFRTDAAGTHAIGRADDGLAGIVLAEQQLGPEAEPTLDDIRAALRSIYGTDFGIHSPNWVSRFTDMTRQADSYRQRRVLLAGDAAHVHAPIGGQGLNLGIQDAVNLGWKLAQVVSGVSDESLLDTYGAERHPVAARVLRTTMAQSALRRPDEHTKALSEIVSALLEADDARKRMAGELSGLDIHYDLGDGHPLLGRRMPDLDLITGDGPLRVYELLHGARPALINFGDAGTVDIGPWGDRVQSVDATCAARWELPVIGQVSAPGAVLVRPDGYVAWVGDNGDAGLAGALTAWFGSGPASSR